MRYLNTKKIYEYLGVDSDGARQAEYGYIGYSGRWVWNFEQGPLQLRTFAPKIPFTIKTCFSAIVCYDKSCMGSNKNLNLKYLKNFYIWSSVQYQKVHFSWCWGTSIMTPISALKMLSIWCAFLNNITWFEIVVNVKKILLSKQSKKFS